MCLPICPSVSAVRTAWRMRQVPHLFTLFGLAPDGVYQADRVTSDAGVLLPHRFTLTTHRSIKTEQAVRRFTLCCTFPSLTAGRRYRPSCPTEPGLSSSVPRGTPAAIPPTVSQTSEERSVRKECRSRWSPYH